MTDESQHIPRVAVVIPTFNSSGTIERSLESCLAQTRLPSEIIVVDDASSEGTVAMAEQYLKANAAPRHVPYRIIRHAANEGPSKSRNDGWNAAAGGGWIAFLDADDMWHPAKLKTSLGVAAAHPRVALVAHAFQVDCRLPDAPCWMPLPATMPQVRKTSFLSLLLYNTISAPTVLVARDLSERFREDMRHNEDHELWLRIAASHEVLFYGWPMTRLGRPLLTAGGASSSLWKMRCGELRMYFHAVRLRWWLPLLFPVLMAWSLAKHVGICLCLWIRGSVPHVAWKR